MGQERSVGGGEDGEEIFPPTLPTPPCLPPLPCLPHLLHPFVPLGGKLGSSTDANDLRPLGGRWG
ncbi:hypothetical protein NSTC745_03254 [Nostoc sp. DSM 114161]|jgi:hypothetical protein